MNTKNILIASALVFISAACGSQQSIGTHNAPQMSEMSARDKAFSQASAYVQFSAKTSVDGETYITVRAIRKIDRSEHGALLDALTPLSSYAALLVEHEERCGFPSTTSNTTIYGVYYDGIQLRGSDPACIDLAEALLASDIVTGIENNRLARVDSKGRIYSSYRYKKQRK